MTDWKETLDTLRRQWEQDDDAIDWMPDSLLSEALDNPYLSELDKARVKKRLAEKGKAA